MPESLHKPDNSGGLTVSATYAQLVDGGNVTDDPEQRRLVARLDALLTRLETARLATKSSALGWLFGRSKPKDSPKGLYIWGGVGRGKSFLMDLFFERVPNKRKRRIHFNDFMNDVHERVHELRKSNAGQNAGEDKIIPVVADQLAEEARILCFDEFTVTDITDAMLLGRLFEHLFKKGVTIVATSNVAPDDLYKGGLNRALFLPFIQVLKDNVEVFQLDAETDYRLEKLQKSPVYLTPLSTKNLKNMEDAWLRMTAGGIVASERLEIKGRSLHIPAAAQGVARFSFYQLCEEPKGAADYLALARNYHTIFIDGVRVIKAAERNVAKRFILMIDTFYDNRIKLVLTAEASPNALYLGTWGTEAFEFERTVSRLIEMQSEDYISGRLAS